MDFRNDIGEMAMRGGVPQILKAAWADYDPHRELLAVEEISAKVSTNRVYRLVLGDRKELVAKVSCYGSFVHFRQDHQLIQSWIRHLGGTRFRSFLAEVAQKDGRVYTYRQGERWVAFYHKTAFYDFLPKLLTHGHVCALAHEMAEFHAVCTQVTGSLHRTWKTVGSDIASLYDVLGNPAWRSERGIDDGQEDVLKEHCDQFLENAERLGYHLLPRLPILIDWNIGNFSVGFDGDGFRFFSRWDYDWFRIEPRVFDFYFLSRVVRDEGDQTVFSYTTEPLVGERFVLFLREYHRVFPLTEHEILFFKEAYRFFILAYVVRSGEHFFRRSIWQRLLREAITQYLPSLGVLDMRPVVDAVLAPRAPLDSSSESKDRGGQHASPSSALSCPSSSAAEPPVESPVEPSRS